ncbi:unnamed protein product [Callosobruchus maculatus]|uniref:RNase H type-1 domain-containing protein n=1 Tax=Callosobruchus maculatus TaxID=64391 RepID=A0A653CH81_CALMS|nr:unnamed protein product [Callosobruchus maculatus]
MFTAATLSKFNDRPTVTKPLGVRCRELLQDIHTELPTVHTVEYKTPPWIVCQPKVNLECTRFKKSETNPQIYQNIISNIINRYRPVTTIYTDGSKSNSGVGAAVVGEGEIWKGSLNSMSSIYTAELTAIYQALIYVHQNSSGTYLICSDSLSSLQNMLVMGCTISLKKKPPTVMPVIVVTDIENRDTKVYVPSSTDQSVYTKRIKEMKYKKRKQFEHVEELNLFA